MARVTPSTPPPSAPSGDSSSADQRIITYNVPWSAYEAQLALRGEAPVPRLTYLDGVLEVMRPCRDHGRLKSYLGCLIEVYALERDIDLSPYGSWTLRHAPKAGGLEPDECYIIGADQRAERPDLAIEVVWTSGGLDKLAVYARLEVPEVWIWRDDNLHIHVLRGAGYEEVERSEQLPGIDLNQLLSFIDRPTAMQAVRAYRAALQNRS